MRFLFLSLALLSLSLPARTNTPAVRFTVTDLGAIPKSDYAPGAQALNDRGQVVGGFGHAFLWDNGRAKDLGTLPAQEKGESQSSIAQAINNRGQVVGTSGSFSPILMSGIDERGFLYRDNALHHLTRKGLFDQFEPNAISDKGQIVGEDRGTNRGFFYADGRLTILGTFSRLPVGNYSEAQSINSFGQVAGWSTVSVGHTLPTRAFLWQRVGRSGRMRDLGTLPGWASSYAHAINDRGEVAGSLGAPDAANGAAHGVRPDSSLAFLWRQGKMTSLGTLPGRRSSEALGINNAGAVVGRSGGRAFLWQGGRMLDLNALLPAGSDWVLAEARAINNKGQIAGNGTLHGAPHAFLLTPR